MFNLLKVDHIIYAVIIDTGLQQKQILILLATPATMKQYNNCNLVVNSMQMQYTCHIKTET